MASIHENLSKIINAVFGRDIRQALHDGLDAINKETESTTSRQDYLDRKYDEQIKNMTVQDPSSAEIVDMRVAANGKTFEKAGDRLNYFDEQLDTKANELENKKMNKTDVLSMSNMGQDIKEAMTGGSVAVVGVDSVLDENIVNNQISAKKTNFIKEKYNILNLETRTDSKVWYWNGSAITTLNEGNSYTIDRIKLEKNITYTIQSSKVYFSFLVSLDGTKLIQRLGESDVYSNVTITPTENCYLYLSFSKVTSKPMVVNDVVLPSTYVPPGTYEWTIFNKNFEKIIDGISDLTETNKVDIDSLKNGEGIIDNSITPSKLSFIDVKKNLLDSNKVIASKVWHWNGSAITTLADEGSGSFQAIRLKQNQKYSINNARGFFSYLISLDGKSLISKFATTDMTITTSFTPVTDCYLYLSYKNVNIKGAMVVNDGELPPNYVPYGDYSYKLSEVATNLLGNINKKIVVKKDGTGDFVKLIDAINSITDSSVNNIYDVYVYSGTYDIVEELGGISWVNSVTTDGKERQGLALPDFVNLIGVGNVHIKCEVEDEDATLAFTKCVSTINIWKNNNLKNILFTSKNTRYTCHDETNNQFSYLNRKVENCQFIHHGNKEGLWGSDKAYAGGTGSGGNYEFINCIFEAKKDSPFTFHNNGDQESNTFNLDGCKFISNGHSYCIGFGYYKINNKNNINRVFIKNCNLDNFIWVHPEVSSVESTNVFEIHNYTDSQVKVV